MQQVTIEIEGTSYLSQSKLIPPKPSKSPGTAEDYERAHWREKAHVSESGEVVIPGVSIHAALVESARRLGLKHKRMSLATFVQSGLMVAGDVGTGASIDTVKAITIPCSVKGIRGAKSGSRVPRSFPMIPPGWRGTINLVVFEPILQGETGMRDLKRITEYAGVFVGLGRWRPETGGYNGRFQVNSFTPGEIEKAGFELEE